MAYVPGELRLPERVTGDHLVATIGHLRGGFDSRRRDDLADRLQLDLSRNVGELSTGNRRKLALLIAFVADTELLVLDEPTNGLDPLMQREFLALVHESKTRGTTIFLSSHVLSEVQRAADRVAVLRRGKVIASGTVDELRGKARQHVEIWFSEEPPIGALSELGELQDLAIEGRRVTATLSGPIQPLLALLARQSVSSMLIEEPDLEQAFLDLYRETDQ